MSTAMREQVKSAIDSTADKAKHATDWVGDHADMAMNKASDAVNTAEDRAKCAANKMSNTVSRAAEPMRNMLQDRYDQGKQEVSKISEDATILIRKHPLTTLAIGFAFGALIGHVASRA